VGQSPNGIILALHQRSVRSAPIVRDECGIVAVIRSHRSVQRYNRILLVASRRLASLARLCLHPPDLVSLSLLKLIASQIVPNGRQQLYHR
jgi:hypothetical protein